MQCIFLLASLEVELSRPFPYRTQNINIRALKWKQDLGSHCFTRLLSIDLWPSLRSHGKSGHLGCIAHCGNFFFCCYDCCFPPPGLFWLNLGLWCKISPFQEPLLTSLEKGLEDGFWLLLLSTQRLHFQACISQSMWENKTVFLPFSSINHSDVLSECLCTISEDP